MIHFVFKCRNSSLDCCDTVKKFNEKITEQSIMTKLLMNARKKQFDNTEYWSVEMKKDFVNAPHLSIDKWISVLARGGGQKKWFQYCWNPNYLHQFLYTRASSNPRTFSSDQNLPLHQNNAFSNGRRSLGENAAISQTDMSRTSTTSTTRSAIRRRRKLR